MTSTYKLTFKVDDDQLDHAIMLMEEHLNATAVSTTRTDGSSSQWTCEAYFVDIPDRELQNSALKQLNGYSADGALLPDLETLPDVDWVSKVQKDLAAVPAGSFIIHGSHERELYGRRPLAIEIDAGQAFGTAHHGTTKGCLIAIQDAFKKRQFKNVLDLGTGSGVLSIAAKKVSKGSQVIASDIDKISTEVALENCKINNLGNLVNVIHASGLDHPVLKQHMPFDLIIANILAEPLIQLSHKFSRSIEKGGTLILSGLLRTQSREVTAHYINNGFSLEKRFPIDEWMTLVLSKRTRNQL